MKKILLSVIIFLLIFIIGCSTEVKQPNVVEVEQLDDPLAHMNDVKKAEFNDAMEESKDNVMVMDDASPGGLGMLSGVFKPKAHDVEGTATLVKSGGKKVLRFTDFETINGPLLHIWLSADLKGLDYVDLGKIKATSGNVNYDIPENTDISKYNKVLVWCVPFKVLFSYAELT
jgi:hypothetical protein